MENEILTRLKRIESKLDALLQAKQKQTLVKASVITELTKWSYEEMRRAKINGYVKQKKTDKGIFYVLESLNPVFIKK